MAMNYNVSCGTKINGKPLDDCPWGTEECIYCTDLFETEEERWEHCCDNPFAENFNDSLANVEWCYGTEDSVCYSANYSFDTTYCIFDE
jgi:hypothetical protein